MVGQRLTYIGMRKFIMILILCRDQIPGSRATWCWVRPVYAAGAGRAGEPKGTLIADAYTTRYEHGNQETHTEDQGRQRAGPPEAGRRSAGDREHNPGGQEAGYELAPGIQVVSPLQGGRF